MWYSRKWWRRWRRCAVTFLLQGELPLVLYVLQRGGQVPGQTAGAVGPQKGTLWDTRITTS